MSLIINGMSLPKHSAINGEKDTAYRCVVLAHPDNTVELVIDTEFACLYDNGHNVQRYPFEAHKQRINANTVFLNSEIALVKRSYEKIGNTVAEIPPMICGLSAFLTDELPDNVAFAVCETSAETELEKARREAKQELIEELRTKSLAEIVEMIETQRGDNF